MVKIMKLWVFDDLDGAEPVEVEISKKETLIHIKSENEKIHLAVDVEDIRGLLCEDDGK